MIDRRNLLKAGAGLVASVASAWEWQLRRRGATVLVISSAVEAAAASEAAYQFGGGAPVLHQADNGDCEAIVAMAQGHLRHKHNILYAATSPALHLLLRVAVRESGGRLVADHELVAQQLLIARN